MRYILRQTKNSAKVFRSLNLKTKKALLQKLKASKLKDSSKNINSQPQEDFPLEQTGWLDKNPEALALVKLGIEQVKQGKVKRMSFVEYADLEIDD